MLRGKSLKTGVLALLLVALGAGPSLAQDCGSSLIFEDGFESGDTSAWGLAPREPYDHVVPADVGVTLGVGVVGPVPTEVYTGSTTIDVPTTLENVVVEGCLRIRADDVTVRNVVIECGGLYPIKVEGGSRDFRIEYSRVECSSSSKAFYFESGAPGAQVARNEIIGCQDFFYIQGDLEGVVVADNYMHTLVGEPTAHADGFQIGEASAATGAMQIRGNYIDPDNPEIGRTDVVFGTNFSEVDLLIEDNYLEPWGHYTMRCGGEATRCTIRNNVYGPGFENVGQHLLLVNSAAPPMPSEFCCNRYASGGLVEEFYNGQDLVLGAEHWIEGCPSMPVQGDAGLGGQDAKKVRSELGRTFQYWSGTSSWALQAGNFKLGDARPVRGQVNLRGQHVYNTYNMRKLTITIDDEVYEGLYRRVGKRKIGRFLEALARPHVVDEDLEAGYRAMAADEVREAEAEEWSEELIGDVSDEPR